VRDIGIFVLLFDHISTETTIHSIPWRKGDKSFCISCFIHRSIPNLFCERSSRSIKTDISVQNRPRWNLYNIIITCDPTCNKFIYVWRVCARSVFLTQLFYILQTLVRLSLFKQWSFQRSVVNAFAQISPGQSIDKQWRNSSKRDFLLLEFDSAACFRRNYVLYPTKSSPV